MEQHELARDFYHRLAHRVAHADTKETFEYLAKEAEENDIRQRAYKLGPRSWGWFATPTGVQLFHPGGTG